MWESVGGVLNICHSRLMDSLLHVTWLLTRKMLDYCRVSLSEQLTTGFEHTDYACRISNRGLKSARTATWAWTKLHIQILS